MGSCQFCGKNDPLISNALQACRDCILSLDWSKMIEHFESIHVKYHHFPPISQPSATNQSSGISYSCDYCINQCIIHPRESSYCGLRRLDPQGKPAFPFPTKNIGYMHGYLDPNPTNCCNAWICPAGSQIGYPIYSDQNGPELGTYNYAAFFYGCSMNCLFCQNASHKTISKQYLVKAEEIAMEIAYNVKISCLCYFGGTPEPQLPFSINLAKQILNNIQKSGKNRIFRICWEWNGTGKQALVEKCMKIALKTGGNIKFDLKSYHEKLNIALCGVSNKRTLDNFIYLAEKYFGTRKNVPEMTACTLLVPGYVNHEEVEQIARFVASINDEIPYSLLVFHPDHRMKDLPITPKEEALKCLATAKQYLKNVNLGNQFLLHL